MHRDFILDLEPQALSSKGFLVGFVQAIAKKQLVELRNLLYRAAMKVDMPS